jgi:hypothetical protein
MLLPMLLSMEMFLWEEIVILDLAVLGEGIPIISELE